MSIKQRVEALQDYIRQGKILEAMTEFYSPDVAMQENRNAPVVGLPANIEREKQFLANVKVWKGYTVKSLAVGDNVTAVESVIEFTNTQDQPVRLEQVAVQRWNDRGTIDHERFYYDTAA